MFVFHALDRARAVAGFGGATNVTDNLIFNQCRESGEHGPINSWDRTAYLSDVLHGEPSYEAAINHVTNNMIIANYGSSQGFDTDDGSSWYNISQNFFFMADAWKMDYGGHDSYITGNVVYHGSNDGQNCYNTWPFLPGHGAVYEDNKCVLPDSDNLGNLFYDCDCPGASHSDPWSPGDDDPEHECGVRFAGNQYFTKDANATVSCSDPSEAWKDWRAHNEPDATLEALPTDDELLDWARAVLRAL